MKSYSKFVTHLKIFNKIQLYEITSRAFRLSYLVVFRNFETIMIKALLLKIFK